MKLSASLIHLRWLFSFFLLPVFGLALAFASDIDWTNAILAFISLHIFIYPASNGFNSYYDKDKKEVALIKAPPPIDKQLLFASNLLDILGWIVAWAVSPIFLFGIIVYTLISRAYSHPRIRLKKFPFLSFFTIALFQGAWIYAFADHAISGELLNLEYLWVNKEILMFCSLIIGAGYPLTQIYQHEEDKKRGDLTLSRVLGIRGTFVFSACLFIPASATGYFQMGIINLTPLLPLTLYFLYWAVNSFNNPAAADFSGAMKLVWIQGICMNLLWLWILFL